jgi:hypothetical protein
MSLWRKRNVHHNEQKPDHLVNILTNSSIKSEQKHDILTYPLDILHDLSIKSDDLSIKSEEAMRDWVGLPTVVILDIYAETLKEHCGGSMPDGQIAFAKAIEQALKERNP